MGLRDLTCNFSIQLGSGFFWCLTLFISGLALFIGWHSSRLYHDGVNERALRRGQESLLGAKYKPLVQRERRERGHPQEAIVALMRVRTPEERAQEDAALTRRGWRRLPESYNVAAE